jgi:hypothetical protein
MMSLLPLNIVRGDDAQLAITVQTADGAAYDLTGCTLWLTIKRSAADADGAAIAQCSTTAGTIALANAAAGEALATVPAAATIALTETTQAVYDVQLRTAAGKTHTVVRGRIIIHADVTRA